MNQHRTPDPKTMSPDWSPPPDESRPAVVDEALTDVLAPEEVRDPMSTNNAGDPQAAMRSGSRPTDVTREVLEDDDPPPLTDVLRAHTKS